MSQRPAHLASSDRRLRRDAALAPLRAVAETVSDAMICADAVGRITLWAGGAEAIFGYRPAEALGRPLADLMPERYRSRHAAGLARVVAGGEPRIVGGGTIEVEGLRSDGQEFPAELTLSRGEIEGQAFFVGVVRDVSARHEAERELRLAQERFRSAFEHAGIGMTVSALDGTFVSVNPAFAALVGRDRRELERLSSAAITHPDDRAGDLAAAARLLGGASGSVRREKRYLRPDESTIWVDASISLVRDVDGRAQHFLTQAQDITERRRNAEELKRSNAELQQFAHVASHDLREPLRIVDGFLHLLETRSSAALDEDGRRFIAHALAGTARMREVIESFLRYARAGAGGLALENVRVGSLAREAVTSLGAAIGERRAHVTVDVGDDIVATADRALVRQVLQNLLANAVRHAAHDRPRVQVRATRRDGVVDVSVADNGAGIPAEDRERVFEMFVHGSGGVSGLGLAICRRVIERHGGEIWIDESHGGGADIHFTLPHAAATST
jgi:PAS domain S-box-containing protein